MDRLDTSLGGAGRAFPSTRWSMIHGAQEPGSPAFRDAVNHLGQAYWKPIYAYIRAARRFSNEESKDLTQEFFLELIEGGLLERFAPEQGSFRNYLRGAIRLFLLEHHQKEGRLKRGGGRKILSLDDERVGPEEFGSDRTPEEEFDLNWAKTVFQQAMTQLRGELEQAGRATVFQLFNRYELAEPALTYDALAEEFGVKETDVENHLKHCRKRLRVLVLDQIRDTVTNEAEVTSELSRILDILGRT